MLSAGDQRALLRWYDDHQRDLPWRATSDPWAILLSEILLQQTQVVRGRVFWERMMAAFPTVQSMASASVDEVLKAWEGAGYYSRARRLHALSQTVVLPEAKGGHGGRLPSDAATLLTLPGIGPYTAAAVASIAFGEAAACVDGNVRRVMARLTATAEPTAREVQAWADEVLSHERPGDWNQAVMELGATVCTPKRARCTECPLQASCRGIDAPEHYPVQRRTTTKAMTLHANVEVDGDGRPVLHQRQATGLFAGLWGPPYGDQAPQGEGWLHVGQVKHALSHRKITVEVHVQTQVVNQGIDPATVACSVMDTNVLALALEGFHRSADARNS